MLWKLRVARSHDGKLCIGVSGRHSNNTNCRLMIAASEIPDQEAAPPSRLCAACSARSSGWCSGLLNDRTARLQPAQPTLDSLEHTVAARRIICRDRDFYEFVPVICSGWAASSATLVDGRKQILAFLLPGDIVSTTLLFEPNSHCVVEAITAVEYRTFPREEIKKLLFKDPRLIRTLSTTWISEKLAADQLAIDLGRRTAHERIARLIESLRQRLEVRGMTRGLTMEFPLRQHHIADATGLTPVHVSKVLSEFRRAGLIEIGDRSITILNPDKLMSIGSPR